MLKRTVSSLELLCIVVMEDLTLKMVAVLSEMTVNELMMVWKLAF